MKEVVRSVRINLLFALLVSTATCAAVWAQSTAQVSGTVVDQSGAVLPGVEVTVIQTGTGLARSVVTNETGSYAVPSLPVGPYRLEAALPGFRSYVQTGIVLTVGANSVINITLEVGAVSEAVEVQADAALVETRSTGVSQVMDNIRVLELPLNGRQVTVFFGAYQGTKLRASPVPRFSYVPTPAMLGGDWTSNYFTGMQQWAADRPKSAIRQQSDRSRNVFSGSR